MKLAKTIIALSFCFIIGATFFSFAQTAHAESFDVKISEIYPNPANSGESEFIEIFNSGLETVDLTNWWLDDREEIVEEPKSSTPFSLKGELIGPGEYKAFYKKDVQDSSKSTGISLNNDSDAARVFHLKAPNQDLVIDEVRYNETKKGCAYAYFGVDGWKWTTAPTPGFANKLTQDFSSSDNLTVEEKTIEQARTLENGEDVTIKGTVTVVPGVLSSQYFYVEDETGGIQVYSYYKNFPALSIGDQISVAGSLSETNSERRLKITSAGSVIIQSHTNPLPPTQIAISDIDEKTEGTYVKTAGIVTQTSGDVFYIGDGQSEIKVSINKTTGIEKPKMKRGDQVEVTGIVSQYKNEYRILPIDQDDVKIIATEKELPRVGIGNFLYLFISLFSSILWNMYREAKKKHST